MQKRGNARVLQNWWKIKNGRPISVLSNFSAENLRISGKRIFDRGQNPVLLHFVKNLLLHSRNLRINQGAIRHNRSLALTFIPAVSVRHHLRDMIPCRSGYLSLFRCGAFEYSFAILCGGSVVRSVNVLLSRWFRGVMEKVTFAITMPRFWRLGQKNFLGKAWRRISIPLGRQSVPQSNRW